MIGEIMTSRAKRAANRRNSKLSTGPSQAARERTKYNGVTHGMRAKTQVLPGEDPLKLDAMRLDWHVSLQPRDPAEVALVDDIANARWLLERAERALFEHSIALIEQDDARQALDVEEDVRRLFHDASGSHWTYALSSEPCDGPTTSLLEKPDDPNQPSTLVVRLESSEKGCQVLIGNWRMLRARLEQDLAWQPQDRLKAIRMLGRQPLEVIEDQRVWLIYVCCFALHPLDKDHPFDDFKCEMGKPALDPFLARVQSRWPRALDASDKAEAKQTLLDLVDRNLERLEAKVEVYRQLAAATAASRAARLAGDPSIEGERLRRYELACQRRVHRCLDAFWKYRRENGGAEEYDDSIADEGGDEQLVENAPDSALESGVAEVASSVENKNLTTEANVGLTAAELQFIKEIAAADEEMRTVLKELAKMRGEGKATVGTPAAGGGTGRSAILDAIFPGEPLPPPIS